MDCVRSSDILTDAIVARGDQMQAVRLPEEVKCGRVERVGGGKANGKWLATSIHGGSANKAALISSRRFLTDVCRCLSQEWSLWLQKARTEEERSKTAENAGDVVAKRYWQLTCDNF